MPKFVDINKGPTSLFLAGFGGTLKSTLISSMPKPMEVIFTDPFKKENPYFKRGLVTEKAISPEGILYSEVYSKKDQEKRIIRINYIHENDPDNPTGWDEFERVWRTIDCSSIRTLVLDSYTSWEYLARSKVGVLPHDEMDNWFVPREAKKLIIKYMRGLFLAVPCNFVIIGHLTKERVTESKGANESMITHLFAPAAIGDLKEDLPRIFPETWITRVVKSEGEKKILLQTEISNKYYACTQLHVPDGIELTEDTTWKDLMESTEINQ